MLLSKPVNVQIMCQSLGRTRTGTECTSLYMSTGKRRPDDGFAIMWTFTLITPEKWQKDNKY